MRKRHLLMAMIIAGSMSMLVACGGGSKEAETAATTAAETKVAATEAAKEKETGKKEETEAATETATEAEKKAEADSADVGKFIIYEYEAGGHPVTHEMLVEAGMGDTYLELYKDGTGKFNLFHSLLDITWEPGEITVYGTTKYKYELEGDTLKLDMLDVAHYTMVRDDGSTPAETAATEASESKDETEEAKETTEAKDNASETEAAADSGKKVPDGVASGDGLVSEEDLQKGYVWLNKVAKDVFNLTYEDLADHFGVEGEFDKEEYSDHMQRNKRYYKWISKDDSNHFIYVNFDEKDATKEPGVFRVSSFNTSGFKGSDAEAKYLDAVKAEASEADKAATANAKMKDFTVEVSPWGHDEDVVKIGMQIPETGWSYDESRTKFVDNEDVNAFGAGFIKFELKEDVEKFDFYKDKFENYKEIDSRDFGGKTFKGRTYKNIGYNWTEYIAQLDDTHALSIGIVDVDLSDGTMGDKILDSISFK